MALQDRSTKRDFHPEIRVMIETERPLYERFFDVDAATLSGGTIVSNSLQAGVLVRSGGTIISLENDSIMDANVSSSINRPSSATFTMANVNDKFFKKARSTPQKTARQQAVSAYMMEALKVSEVIERNTERRIEYYERLDAGILPLNLTNFVQELDNGKIISANAPLSLTREQAYSLYEYFSPDFQLMNRVWIDLRDRDGNWVPSFTGFLSMIQKVRVPSQTSAITLTCKGMMAFLQRSEIVISRAIDQTFEPLTQEEASKTDQQPFTNAFAGLNGDEIIRRVLSYARDIYCFNSGDTSKKISSDYFHQDKLWRFSGDPVIRDGTVIGTKGTEGYGAGGSDVEPRRDFVEGTTTTQDYRMTGKLLTDPEITNNSEGQRDIFNKVIRQTFQIYQNTNQFAYNLIREVVDLMGYDFFDDPRGNFVFQAPKYDKLPRLRGDTGALAEDAVAFGEDYSTIPYHGRDYVLDHIGDKGIRETETEDGIVTTVIAKGGVDLIPNLGGADIEFQVLVGVTSPQFLKREISEEISDQIIRLNRRYGVRRQTMRQIVTGMNATNYLTRYAYANLVQINSGRITGSMTLHQRPDLWVGRSVFLAEAQKLAYVVGTSNAFNKSGRSNHSTTLTLAFMHHPSEKIGVPWLINTNSPQSKAPAIPQNALYNAELAEAISKL